MSLIGALNIGKTALSAHQAAIQVSSNNIANAGNADYTRQVAGLSPGMDVGMQPGVRMGTGVYLDSIARQVDDALEERIRGSISDDQAAGLKQQYLDRVESVFNALGEDDLSSQLSAFFNSWSSLANNPLDQGLRQVVLQTGDTIANTFKSMRAQFNSIVRETDTARLSAIVTQANQLVDQVARFNQQISTAEAGTGQGANALRDQRDATLKELSQLVDIKVQDTGNGMVNVMVGSEPIVLQNTSRGLKLSTTQVDGRTETMLTTIANDADLKPTSGQIGALLSMKENTDTVDQLDTLAGNLVFELNKLHSSGQGSEWLTTATASNNVADPTAALNSAGADLPFTPTTGNFIVQVRQKSTGLVTSQLVTIDLDGQNDDDTTLESLAADLSTVSGLSATAASGRLRVSALSDYEFSFSQDTSGTLAAVGVNSFFTGTNASNITVAAELRSRPTLIAAAANGERGDNTNARAIAQLESKAISGLNGQSLRDGYASLVTSVATESSNARTAQQAAQAVGDTLTSQRESLSGVSLDEEAINLIREQRAFQAAARVISTIDQMMQTLLQIT